MVVVLVFAISFIKFATTDAAGGIKSCNLIIYEAFFFLGQKILVSYPTPTTLFPPR